MTNQILEATADRAMSATAFRGADKVRRVAVIGAGLIGAGWAAAFLAHGLSVIVYDPAPGAAEKVRGHVGRAWPELAALGLVAPGATLPRLDFADDLAAAVDGADFVQENTPERGDLKSALFAELDRLAPADVIIASSTSSLPISDLQSGCVDPGRCVLGHPFNPVHLMPLVELGGGQQTDPAAIEAAAGLYVAMGKKPIRLKREIFGHIANRLTSAMFREAVSLVADGYATVKDIDDAIRYGPALKWAVQGQFTTFHTGGGDGGLRSFLPHFAPGIVRRWQSMSDPDLADPALREMLAAQVEEATGYRQVADIARDQDAAVLRLLLALYGS